MAAEPDNRPPQVRMGLLDYITANSMDEDYVHASIRHDAERTSSAGPVRRRPVRPGVAAMVILAVFGLLVATAAVQTSRNAVAAENGRGELVSQIKARSAEVNAVRDQILAARRDVADLQAQFLDTTAEGRGISARLDRLGVRTGELAVQGPGVKVVVDDAADAATSQQEVLDQDLQRLVNALWESGAEAISINGQRITNLTAIRHAGSAITVNFRSIARPYVVSVIGDPDSIPARFIETEHGSQWLDLQATYGLLFDMTTEESLTLPAANRLDLRFATTTGGSR